MNFIQIIEFFNEFLIFFFIDERCSNFFYQKKIVKKKYKRLKKNSQDSYLGWIDYILCDEVKFLYLFIVYLYIKICA